MRSLVSILLLYGPYMLCAQSFQIQERGIFSAQNKTVLLLKDASSDGHLILFSTRLVVNTDGSPLSYHPEDLTGQRIALNTIANAVAIYRTGSKENLCLNKKSFSEAIRVFKEYEGQDFQSVPQGYTIRWHNVLASEVVNGIQKPCIFKTGPYKGYFGSLTSLKNGIAGNKGECDINDQVNPLEVSGLVLAGGNNVLKKFGASVGDLVIAYHPVTKNIVYAIINDTGPENNLGEGSVLLNMKLLGRSKLPVNRADAYGLTIKDQVLIAIIPRSRAYKQMLPYTACNITSRVVGWMHEKNLTETELLELFQKFHVELER